MWLKIIGCILLGLLLLLIAGAILILCARTRLEVRGKNGAVTVRIGLGPLLIQIWPMQKKPENPPAAQPAPEDQTSRKENTFDWKRLGFSDAMELIFDLLEQFQDKLRIETLMVNAVFATGDAASTGLLLGGVSAGTGILMPYIKENFHVDTLRITLDADFEAGHTKWAVVFVCAIRPVHLLYMLLHRRKRLYALYRRITKKDEE